MSDLKTRAHALIPPFLSRRAAGMFFAISREDIARQLAERIDTPGKIKQHAPSLCGRTALLYRIAYSNPVMYARFAIDLYERGRAMLEGLNIKPGAHVRRSCAKPGMPALDWMMLESLRGSRNWFLVYQRATRLNPGLTPPIEMLQCFRRAGYRWVFNDTGAFAFRDMSSARSANSFFRRNYRVCLLINSNIIKGQQGQISFSPDQWLVLASEIRMHSNTVSFDVFTKSGRRDALRVPRLTEENFVANYYGFIACSDSLR